MVPRCSDRIARVPPYSLSLTNLVFHLQGYHLLRPAFPDCSIRPRRITTTGLVPFRSPLLRESRLISFPPVTEMFQFPGFPRAFRARRSLGSSPGLFAAFHARI